MSIYIELPILYYCSRCGVSIPAGQGFCPDEPVVCRNIPDNDDQEQTKGDEKPQHDHPLPTSSRITSPSQPPPAQEGQRVRDCPRKAPSHLRPRMGQRRRRPGRSRAVPLPRKGKGCATAQGRHQDASPGRHIWERVFQRFASKPIFSHLSATDGAN